MATLLVFERLLLAAGAIGITRRPLLTWGASLGVVALWGIRGAVRQNVSKEARKAFTMKIAETALSSSVDGSLMSEEEGEAAVFEGRYAAEQVLIGHVPRFVAEPTAALVLLYLVKPSGTAVLATVGTLAAAATAMGLMRTRAMERQKFAWRKYMHVAQGTLTSIRASTELKASGHERVHLERLRGAVDDWTGAAARAERSAALFQRVPFVAAALLVVAALPRASLLEINAAIRLGIFLPPVAGFMRSMFDLLRMSPKIEAFGSAIDVQVKPTCGYVGKIPRELPCEIRFEAVSFSYGETPVLENVSFSWLPGQLLGIRGSNGAGKSTLLKLILGLVEPNEGRILVGDVDLRDLDLSAWRANIGYLSQKPYWPEKATVLEVMQLTLPGLTETEADGALSRMGLHHQVHPAMEPTRRLHTAVASLSAGVRQKVMLARALARPVALLLLDEPDENLDIATQTMLRQTLRTLARSHMVAVATHDEALLTTVNLVIDVGTATG